MTARRRPTVVPDQVPELERAIREFLVEKRSEGVRPRTAHWYDATLSRVFLPWVSERGFTSFEQLSQHDINEFAAEIQSAERGLTPETAATYLRCVRTFFRWAGNDEQGLTAIKVRPVKTPKRRIRETLSRSEINELEGAATTERDRLIIRVLGDTGVRLGELLALTPADIIQHGPKSYLRIKERTRGGGAKGDSERDVPLLPGLAKRLTRFATKGRKPEDYSGKIFVSTRRKDGVYRPLNARGVEVMLSAVAETAGITKPTNPHSFRHSYTTNALRAKVNPLLVAQTLGHSSLAMITSTYSHLTSSDSYDALLESLRSDE